jgi:hypothetical protein
MYCLFVSAISFSGVAWIAFQNIGPQSLSAILAHKMEMVLIAFHLIEEFRCSLPQPVWE